MHAIQIHRAGGPDVLTYDTVPDPTPGPDDAVVRVEAIGINFGDTLLRRTPPPSFPTPFIPGAEAAGTVVHAPSSSGVREGDRVVAPLFATGGLAGGYAELVALPAHDLVPLPASIPPAIGVALATQGLTALHLLLDYPVRDRTVLVHTAAGGIGTLLVQLAKLHGAARVIGTASTDEKRALARRLGATDALDYTSSTWADELRAIVPAGPDIIFDSAGGDITATSLELLAPRGTIVVYGAASMSLTFTPAQITRLMFGAQRIGGFTASAALAEPGRLRTSMRELFDLVERGSLEVIIGGTFPLARAADAHRALESRATIGKLVLVP
jgi:NADPH2:quinone reductase